ncbi:hypothetical protein DFS34DRAFT_417776 [Phlyctochytrium arcticum]|nr:hypothetical protein DFS34DRAFT_417776 [Phlyctochytrium arcticum]
MTLIAMVPASDSNGKVLLAASDTYLLEHGGKHWTERKIKIIQGQWGLLLNGVSSCRFFKDTTGKEKPFLDYMEENFLSIFAQIPASENEIELGKDGSGNVQPMLHEKLQHFFNKFQQKLMIAKTSAAGSHPGDVVVFDTYIKQQNTQPLIAGAEMIFGLHIMSSRLFKSSGMFYSIWICTNGVLWTCPQNMDAVNSYGFPTCNAILSLQSSGKPVPGWSKTDATKFLVASFETISKSTTGSKETIDGITLLCLNDAGVSVEFEKLNF